ncbi:MAG: GAF domain-containing protein, partial [Ruminococcaceae bacterium]|nr:GAF domain-containing protein [Oscillospiraceae bacterium]
MSGEENMEKDLSLPQVRVTNLGQQENGISNEKTCSNKPYCNETSRDLEHLQSFLLQLSDKIHNFQNAAQITRVAAQETGQNLAADLAGYVELKEVNGVLEGLFDPEVIWRNPDGAEVEIPAVMELHGTAYRQLLENGQAVAITDYQTDPRSRDGKLVFRLCALSQQANGKQNFPLDPPTDINGAIITSPVRHNNRIAGLLFAYSQKPRTWLPIEISLMHEVVKRAWEAIERARSAAAEAAWSNTLTRLHRLSMMVLNQSDLNRVYHEITKSTIALTEADRCNIQLLDESTGTLTLVSQNQRGGKPFKTKQYSAQGWGVSREAIEQGRRRIVKDITRSPYYVNKPELKILLAAGVRATQATPLVSSAGRTIGILATQYNQPHAYEQREL